VSQNEGMPRKLYLHTLNKNWELWYHQGLAELEGGFIYRRKNTDGKYVSTITIADREVKKD